ncbi:hypothetical protein H0H81_006271 [Sphagnurus paluster]|uniref:Uncharacterized protein n=1 Tax=Sphagnurus paluster TaxID=117069 RepID=A0A9P7FXM7_9AGAR|nr:hypothetical protein H0H81_006271 [Sphagnurus paluster]
MATPAARALLTTDLPDHLIAHIEGNAPRHIKQVPVKWLAIFRAREGSFARKVADRIRITEGTKLRIVNTSMSTGDDGVGSCRSEVDISHILFLPTDCLLIELEIWDVEHHRLVASGVQLSVVPSKPRT